jgi:membrane-associated protein
MLAAVLADIFNTEERLRDFGTLATFVVFGIIFAESGLMIGFFLPGDSLLFTAGLLSVSNTHLAPLPVLIVGCAIAAIAGDQVGYAFGKKVGPPLFSRPDSRFFKQKHLQQAEAFFDRHGSKTIILARFTPIVRTFAPIVAGASHMKYRTFVIYNVIGGIAWTTSMLCLGAALGKTFPGIGERLDYVIVVIVALSLIPFAFEYIRHRRRGAEGDAADAAAANEFVADATADDASA